MKRNVKTSAVVEDEDELTICDSCGLEAAEPVTIVSNPEVEYTGEPDESLQSIRLSELIEEDVEVVGDGSRDLCTGCWREIFDRPEP